MNTHEQDSTLNTPETQQQQHIESSIAEINEDIPKQLLINMAKGKLDPGDIHALRSQTSQKKSDNNKEKKQVTIDPNFNKKERDLEDNLNVNAGENHDKIDTNLHEFVSSNNKLYDIIKRILLFIISIVMVFYYTPKKITANDIICVYPHNSRSNRGALVDHGFNGIIAGEDVQRINSNIPE